MRFLHRQFSIKALFLSIAMIAIVIGWFTHQARMQRKAVNAIKESGGWVNYDFQLTDKRTRYFHDRRPTIPDVFVKFFGVDMFCKVVAVTLHGQVVTNEHVQYLRYLPDVKRLTIAGGTVDSSALTNISHMGKLEVLSLGIPLVDPDIELLMPLKNCCITKWSLCS